MTWLGLGHHFGGWANIVKEGTRDFVVVEGGQRVFLRILPELLNIIEYYSFYLKHHILSYRIIGVCIFFLFITKLLYSKVASLTNVINACLFCKQRRNVLEQ